MYEGKLNNIAQRISDAGIHRLDPAGPSSSRTKRSVDSWSDKAFSPRVSRSENEIDHEEKTEISLEKYWINAKKDLWNSSTVLYTSDVTCFDSKTVFSL